MREIHLKDRSVLEMITGLKELQEFIRDRSTREGHKLELWVSREGKLIRAQVVARKPKKAGE